MVDISATLAALFFLVSNILDIVIYLTDRRKGHFDFEAWKNLNPGYIETEWDWRKSQAPMFHAANVFNAIAWFLLSVPLIQFAWIQSQGGRRKIWCHATLSMLAVGGALTELISRLLIFGAFMTASWISDDFNLNNWGETNDTTGWRVLEVCFIVIEGMLTWVDAFEWFALFGSLSLVYYSVLTASNETRVFSRYWAGMGLLIAFLSFVDFALDVLRWEEWRTFTLLATFISFANTIGLIPLWLLWFGCQLPRAMTEFKESDIMFHRVVAEPPEGSISGVGSLRAGSQADWLKASGNSSMLPADTTEPTGPPLPSVGAVKASQTDFMTAGHDNSGLL